MDFIHLYSLELLSLTQPSRWERAMQIYERALDAGEPSERAAKIATDVTAAEYQTERKAA